MHEGLIMTLTTEREPTSKAIVPPVAPAVAEAAASDRRRPGRLKQVSPELIPILRTAESAPTLEEDMALEDDQLAGMRGVAFGLALSVPLWVGIAYVGRWLLT